jgi:predicted CoA-binding protein
MNTRKNIDSFIEAKQIAIAGVSRNTKKFGNILYTTLKSKGYQVVPVNPNAESIEGVSCVKSISELSPEIQHLLIATNKNATSNVVTEALQKGIQNIWIQNGSESNEALNLLKDQQVNTVSKACFIMYAHPTGFHKFHQCMARVFGGYVSR